MIAIVILGLGLLVVATMFPIAWSKARELTEDSIANTAAANALPTIELLTRTSQPDPSGTGITVSSFFGDLDLDGSGNEIADPWVHALHMQNWIIDAAPLSPPDPAVPLYGDFADADPANALNHLYYVNPIPSAVSARIRPYQVAFQDRFIPALPNPAGLGTGAPLNRWKDLARDRRFCWAALHRLEYDPTAVPSQQPTAAQQRSFTLYLVTLRRGQSTHRFARQDVSQTANRPNYVNAKNAATIAATLPTSPSKPIDFGAADDALLPVPWRVDIELDPPPATPSGIPTEVFTNRSKAANRLVTEMLPAGAWMIDERNGLIYRVVRRDVDPASLPDDAEAVLTLDQEIPPEELDDDGQNGPGDPPEELIRTVWVFPPAVEKTRAPDGLPVFIGPQPVVDITLINGWSP